MLPDNTTAATRPLRPRPRSGGPFRTDLNPKNHGSIRDVERATRHVADHFRLKPAADPAAGSGCAHTVNPIPRQVCFETPVELRFPRRRVTPRETTSTRTAQRSRRQQPPPRRARVALPGRKLGVNKLGAKSIRAVVPDRVIRRVRASVGFAIRRERPRLTARRTSQGRPTGRPSRQVRGAGHVPASRNGRVSRRRRRPDASLVSWSCRQVRNRR